MATNLPFCFLFSFLEQLLKIPVNFSLLKYVKSQRSYGFLITQELIFGFQILDLKDHFSASLSFPHMIWSSHSRNDRRYSYYARGICNQYVDSCKNPSRWFIDNKLSVHFGEEKTKSILFGTKRQLKDQRDLNLKYGDIEIKQHCRVAYLGCILDNILSGEHMSAKVLNTVNNRLKFLYRKQKFLSLSLRRLLCNALIQPHFDYACVAWYPLLDKRQSRGYK